MNNQNFENVSCLPPIVTRQTNVVHRYYLVEQPHVLEQETKYCDHVVKRHTCNVVPMYSNECDYVEENCCDTNFGCGCNNNGQMNTGGFFFF